MSVDTSSPDALVWNVARQVTDEIRKWYKEGQPKGEAKMTELCEAGRPKDESGECDIQDAPSRGRAVEYRNMTAYPNFVG